MLVGLLLLTAGMLIAFALPMIGDTALVLLFMSFGSGFSILAYETGVLQAAVVSIAWILACRRIGM